MFCFFKGQVNRGPVMKDKLPEMSCQWGKCSSAKPLHRVEFEESISLRKFCNQLGGPMFWHFHFVLLWQNFTFCECLKNGQKVSFYHKLLRMVFAHLSAFTANNFGLASYQFFTVLYPRREKHSQIAVFETKSSCCANNCSNQQTMAPWAKQP